MGLDMYLEGKTYIWQDWNHPERNRTKDGFRLKGEILELGYWRKHPDLHGYIVENFADGIDDCKPIWLSADHLRQIIKAIKNKELPKTSGFFFGESDGSEDAESIEIFEKALAWLEGATPPVRREPEAIGGGMSALMVKPDDFVDAKESRDVYYQASW